MYYIKYGLMGIITVTIAPKRPLDEIRELLKLKNGLRPES